MTKNSVHRTRIIRAARAQKKARTAVRAALAASARFDARGWLESQDDDDTERCTDPTAAACGVFDDLVLGDDGGSVDHLDIAPLSDGEARLVYVSAFLEVVMRATGGELQPNRARRTAA
jgi:hypothetical protein